MVNVSETSLRERQLVHATGGRPRFARSSRPVESVASCRSLPSLAQAAHSRFTIV